MNEQLDRFHRACETAWEVGREGLADWPVSQEQYRALVLECNQPVTGLVDPVSAKVVPLRVVTI